VSFLIIFSLSLLVPLQSGYAQFGMKKDLVKIESYISFDKVYSGGEFKLAVITNIEETWHINSNKPYEAFLIPTEISLEENENFKLTKIIYPKAKDYNFSFSETSLSVWEGEILFGGLVKVDRKLNPGKYKLVINLKYQACNDNTCLPPTSVKDTIEIEVVDNKTLIKEINHDIFKQLELEYTPAGSIEESQIEGDPIRNVLENSGLFVGLLLVFIGGLALNLTPCVYPLIPITVGYFGGQSEGRTSKLFLMGLLFVVGMALTYSVIGVITALSGAVFGALLQNNFIILVIAMIFFVLSLSMFGVYEFKLPDSWVAKAGSARSGYYGAFFMGLTMGIVAAPCIGPFVLGLVTYVAAKGDPLFGFLMFFVLAIGLGLPYLLLAVFSGKIKKLPRAGEWMDGVKHIFGFVLIGMALYFLLPLLPKEFSGYILPIYMFLVGIYLLFIERLGNKIFSYNMIKSIVSVVLIMISVYAVIPSGSKSIEWITYSEDAVPVNFENSKGMIIDFYADWCIPCKELDALTFSDTDVIEASKNFYTFKADMTKSLSPEVEDLRQKYNILGVPTVLIINAEGVEVTRITGFVSAKEFLEVLNNI
jgi:thiol:disulfide interchange protein DsbD